MRPLTDAVDAEIRGVDVSGNPDDTTIDAIRTSTLDALGVSCSPEQVLDIVATVTMYHAMAIVTRTFAIPIDEEKPSFSIENVE